MYSDDREVRTFEAMADRIRAGDSLGLVLTDFGYATAIERDALKAALREHEISPIKQRVHDDPNKWWGTVGYHCLRCHEGEWLVGDPERHAPGCLAAPEDAP